MVFWGALYRVLITSKLHTTIFRVAMVRANLSTLSCCCYYYYYYYYYFFFF
jgi:hypothetical protein